MPCRTQSAGHTQTHLQGNAEFQRDNHLQRVSGNPRGAGQMREQERRTDAFLLPRGRAALDFTRRQGYGHGVAPVQAEMDEVNKQRTDLKKKQEGKKDEDIPTAEKDKVNELDKKWDELKTQKEGIFADYAAKNKVVRQLIDLALLQNGMLKGEALNNFVKRSIDLIK